MTSNLFNGRLYICGMDESNLHRSKGVTHILRVGNPGASSAAMSWFRGARLQLWFGDVISEVDAKRCGTKAPTITDVREALIFFRDAWRAAKTKILIQCDYGASRSPALAYVCVADQLGAGQESVAFEIVMKIRPNAVPNKLVVELGDQELARNGGLLQPLRELYSKINEEISTWRRTV